MPPEHNYHPICPIRSRIIPLYFPIRSGLRFSGAGRIAANSAACLICIIHKGILQP